VLHNDKELFEQVVLKTSEYMGIEASIVEKDYFVTLFLKEISKVLPGIIFKGGTSLSKCHKLIKRFSEDIDLNIEYETKATEGQRKNLKKTILSVIEHLDLELTNPDDVRSRRDYNKYIVDFPTVFNSDALKKHLIVETAVYIKAYPNETMEATSLIYDYLLEQGFDDLIEEYDLQPFSLMVQSAERTFVDKIFALGDYYLDDKVREHSRHIYDLYKLMQVVHIDDDLKLLVQQVRQERKAHKQCLSAQDGIDLKELLLKIINEEVYRADYESITEILLFEDVPYKHAILTLQKICDSDIF
jgi:predicted nucleotidyltransferase component of viral defense system